MYLSICFAVHQKRVGSKADAILHHVGMATHAVAVVTVVHVPTVVVPDGHLARLFHKLVLLRQS